MRRLPVGLGDDLDVSFPSEFPGSRFFRRGGMGPGRSLSGQVHNASNAIPKNPTDSTVNFIPRSTFSANASWMMSSTAT